MKNNKKNRFILAKLRKPVFVNRKAVLKLSFYNKRSKIYAGFNRALVLC